MAARRQDLETRLIATDDASKVIDKVADELTALEKRGDTEVTIGVDDQVTAEVRTITQRLEGLSDEDKLIVVKASVDNAEREINRILRSMSRVEQMDDEEIQIRVTALDQAKGDLDRLQSQMRELEQGVDIPVESSGLDSVLGKLDQLPGRFGEIGAVLSGPGGMAAGATAVAVGLVAAANAAADLALDAETMSSLTGDSVEFASQLQSVWGRTGADVNDLNDVLLQMNGVLQQSPELAAQIGVNLDDGATIGERFVEVVGKLDELTGSVAEKAQVKSQLFGEEGVRQVARMTSVVGDLNTAIEQTPAPIDDEDVANAKEMKAAVSEITVEFQQLATEVGENVIPVLAEALELYSMVRDVRELPKDIPIITTIYKNLAPWEQRGERVRQFKSFMNFLRGPIDVQLGPNFGRVVDVVEDIGDASAVSADRVKFLNDQFVDEANASYQAGLEMAANIAAAADRAARAATARARLLNEQFVDQANAAYQAGLEMSDLIDALKEYDRVVGSPDFGAAGVEGAVTAFQKLTNQRFGLADIASNAEEAWDGLADTITRENGKLRYSWDLTKESGRELNDSLHTLADALTAHVAAAFEGADGNWRDFKKNMEEIRTRVVDRLRDDLGVGQEEAEKMANALVGTSKDWKATFELAGQEEAIIQLQLLQGMLEDLDGTTTETTIQQQILAGDYVGAVDTIQDYYDNHPLSVDVVPFWRGPLDWLLGTGSSGSSAPPGSGTLSVGSTAMAAGVTPMAGGGMAPIGVAVVGASSAQPTVNNFHTHITAAVIGSNFDVMRAVEDANRRMARLQPANP